MKKTKAVLNAEPIKHTDVRGNVKYYLKVYTESGEYFINVGLKTYNECSKLQNQDSEQK